MNVTFIIGNGFDLHLGMKTSYKDMYDGYINSLNLDEDIIRFKAELKKDAPTNYTNWSDFEKAMGERANMFQSEAEFVKCIRDFKNYMISYLKKEQEKMMAKIEGLDNSRSVPGVMKESLFNYYKSQTPNVCNTIESIIDGKPLKYVNNQFVSFNYTTILDSMVSDYYRYIQMGKPGVIHIHGTLDNDVVLGVNDISGIECSFELTRKAKRAFVKPEFNIEFDKNRVKKAEEAIENSNVICCYGWSFGETDKNWVAKIKEWLLSSTKHHLFYFGRHKPEYSTYGWDEKMDAEDEHKIVIANKIFGNEIFDTEVLEQIHIPIGFDIFNLDKEFKAKEELDKLKETLLVNN